jgi:single-stranded-DNA-specific exonuclease
MIGALANAADPRIAACEAFAAALATFDRARPVVVLSHFDADGLAAAAVLVRAMRTAGWRAEAVTTGKGETPWDECVRERLAAPDPGGLIVTDLGTRAAPVLPGRPTVVIDHHLPTGEPEGATTISGNGPEPEPTSALLAWWATGRWASRTICCGSRRWG